MFGHGGRQQGIEIGGRLHGPDRPRRQHHAEALGQFQAAGAAVAHHRRRNETDEVVAVEAVGAEAAVALAVDGPAPAWPLLAVAMRYLIENHGDRDVLAPFKGKK